MSNIISELKSKINGKGLRIVFPESDDQRILEAAEKLSLEGILTPVLIKTDKGFDSKYDLSKCLLN